MPKEKARPGESLIARNRRASFDYDLGERFEAGIVLKGSEVKMLRAGKAQLTDAFCTVSRGEAYLQGMSVAEMAGAAFGHLPKGARKLLLHPREIQLIGLAIAREGMTAAGFRIRPGFHPITPVMMSGSAASFRPVTAVVRRRILSNERRFSWSAEDKARIWKPSWRVSVNSITPAGPKFRFSRRARG